MNVTEYILTCLGEECAEIIQNTCKALRFGLEDRNVVDPSMGTNRERLVAELNDLMAVIDFAVDNGILPPAWNSFEAQAAKREKLLKYMDYARSVKSLDGQQGELALEACRDILAWRNSREAPAVLTPRGESLIESVREALGLPRSSPVCDSTETSTRTDAESMP